MTDKQLIKLLCEHIDVYSVGKLHEFLLSGYADGIKYSDPETEDECTCPKESQVQAGDCPAGRWWWECSICGKKS